MHFKAHNVIPGSIEENPFVYSVSIISSLVDMYFMTAGSWEAGYRGLQFAWSWVWSNQQQLVFVFHEEMIPVYQQFPEMLPKLPSYSWPTESLL